MVAYLQLGGNTANRPSINQPGTGQSVSRVRTPRLIVQFLPPVAVTVEDDQVTVDDPPTTVQDQAGRETWLGRLVVAESEVAHRLQDATHVLAGDHHIEISVRARLVAEESVNTPPAI